MSTMHEFDPNYPRPVDTPKTDPLDTLRPEVRQAIELLDRVPNNAWSIVRTDYARLLRRDAELEAYATDMASQACFAAGARAEKAEAELAALKARIAEAKRVRLGTYPAHGSGYVQIIAEPREGDQTFRLLVDEPPAERGEG